MQLGKVSSKIFLNPPQVLLVKYHNMGEIKVLLCILSDFKGRKFKIIVITAYFDIFS